MTLTELRYIITLAQEKHFGKAAKICHVSQPTLSVAIHKVESELGITIFERDHNQVRITSLGQKIVAQAQCTLDAAQEIKDIAEGGKSQLTTPFKIGAIFTVGPYLFPNLIPKIKKLAPHMPLIIQEDYTANLRVQLQQGKLDAIFISLPFSEKGVVTQSLYDEPFVLLLGKEHPLAKQSGIKVADLANEEILLLGEGHCLRDQILQACPHCFAKRGTLEETLEGTSLETLRHMVASGMGITILPSSATQIQYYGSSLVTRPFIGKIPQRRIALAWRMSFTRTKAIDVLIQALKATKLQGVCILPDA